MKQRKQISKCVRERILWMYQDGVRIKDICKMTGIPYSSVYYTIHRDDSIHGFKIPEEKRLIRSKITDKQKRSMDILYNECNYSMKGVSRKLNIPYHQVCYYLSPAQKRANEKYLTANLEKIKVLDRDRHARLYRRKKKLYGETLKLKEKKDEN